METTNCMCVFTSASSYALLFVKSVFLPFSTETISSRPKPSLSSQLTGVPLKPQPPGLCHQQPLMSLLFTTSPAMQFLSFYFSTLILYWALCWLCHLSLNPQHGTVGEHRLWSQNDMGLMPVLSLTRQVILSKLLHLEPQSPYLQNGDNNFLIILWEWNKTTYVKLPKIARLRVFYPSLCPTWNLIHCIFWISIDLVLKQYVYCGLWTIRGQTYNQYGHPFLQYTFAKGKGKGRKCSGSKNGAEDEERSSKQYLTLWLSLRAVLSSLSFIVHSGTGTRL